MERRHEVIVESTAQANLKRYDMVEQGKHVKRVAALGRGTHTQKKLGFEVFHDLLIAPSARSVYLVNDDVVECIGGKPSEVLLARERSDCREQDRCLKVAMTARKQAIGIVISKYALIALERCTGDAFAMDDE